MNDEQIKKQPYNPPTIVLIESQEIETGSGPVPEGSSGILIS